MLKVANSVINASQIATPITFVGDVTLSTGNLIVGTSGKGIDFSATSHPAGMTSELLADYEEGTFTATLTSATPPTTPPTTTARYTKIGRQVSVQIDFSNVDTTGGLGAMSVTGLPFAASTAAATAYCSIGTVGKYQLGVTVSAAGIPTSIPTTLEIFDANNTTLSAIVAGSGRYLFISITYTI
jgi:hypothetical protein